jgi:hypothetical protein
MDFTKHLQIAIRDAGLFLLGCCIGITLECFYSTAITPFIKQNSKSDFTIGLIQILINSFIIQCAKDLITTDISFFVMGLLSPQILIIKKLLIK